MEAKARLINIPTSPRKMRLVVDIIRGKAVGHAFNILKFEPKHGATVIEKVLRSAVANWQVKHPDTDLENANLYVKTIMVDEGRMLKRVQPAPQGRAHRVRKRSNHLTIVIDSLIPAQEGLDLTQGAETKTKEVKS